MNRKADMDTNYPEQLGEWVRQQKSILRDRIFVAFLAIQNEVKAALDAKYPVKTVWKNMHESKQINVGYSKSSLPHHAIKKDSQAKQATPAAATAIRQSAPAKFVFNPVPPEDKELF